jgi:hypothetical protein
MAFVLVRFIQHFEAYWHESLGQLLCDEIGGPHAARLREGRPAVNGRRQYLVLKASLAKAHNDRS